MSTYKMTLIGIERMLEEDGRSVFDRVRLPDGIDKSLMRDNIILQAEEKELLYSDPDFLTEAIGVWSRKNYWTFEKWVNAINIKYDPLNNYDRTEEWTDDHAGTDKRTKNGSYENNGHDVGTNKAKSVQDDATKNITTYDTNVNVDQTVEEKEAAYNASTYQEKTKTDTDSDTKTTGSTTVNNTGDTTVNSEGSTDMVRKDTGSNSDKEEGEDTYQNIHKGRMYGNIGVTTSQQMLQSELDLALWNLYDQIADLFISEFCIMVY